MFYKWQLVARPQRDSNLHFISLTTTFPVYIYLNTVLSFHSFGLTDGLREVTGGMAIHTALYS